MAALVVLTGCLPGHTQPGCGLWPPDAQANGLIDQLGERRFCPQDEVGRVSVIIARLEPSDGTCTPERNVSALP